MNHAITIGELLLAGLAIGGFAMAALGALMFFAAGMSDAADDGTGARGCMVFVLGAAFVAAALAGLLS